MLCSMPGYGYWPVRSVLSLQSETMISLSMAGVVLRSKTFLVMSGISLKLIPLSLNRTIAPPQIFCRRLMPLSQKILSVLVRVCGRKLGKAKPLHCIPPLMSMMKRAILPTEFRVGLTWATAGKIPRFSIAPMPSLVFLKRHYYRQIFPIVFMAANAFMSA